MHACNCARVVDVCALPATIKRSILHRDAIIGLSKACLLRSFGSPSYSLIAVNFSHNEHTDSHHNTILSDATQAAKIPWECSQPWAKMDVSVCVCVCFRWVYVWVCVVVVGFLVVGCSLFLPSAFEIPKLI